MEWIGNNWVFLLFAALFVGMHVFGFGCGAHGKHGKHSEDDSNEDKGHMQAGPSGGSPAKESHGSCH